MKHCLVFASLISPSKMILFEKKYQTFDTVFHHQMKHVEVRQNTLLRIVFSTLFSVFHLVMKHCISCLIYYLNDKFSYTLQHSGQICEEKILCQWWKPCVHLFSINLYQNQLMNSLPFDIPEAWECPPPQGGYLGFQVTGMIEGFFSWFEIFNSRIFLGTKIWLG